MSGPDDLYQSYRVFDSVVSTTNPEAEDLFTKAHLLPHLATLRDELILEIGAGDGRTLRALKRAGFKNATGTDMSPYQVARAHELGSEIELGDAIEALRARSTASVGAIVALDVLEHLPLEYLLSLLEIARDRLRPGGVFIARVPNGESPFGGSILHGDITHLRAFTKRSLIQVFALQGFESVHVFPIRPIVHGPVSAIRAGLWMVVEALARTALAAESGTFDSLHTRNVLSVAKKRC